MTWLDDLRGKHVFDPAPPRHVLHDYHVAFDDLVGARRYEHALDRALREGSRVALVGDSGCGKSSVIAAVLSPLAEGVLPIPVPLRLEAPEVASNPAAFAEHVARVTARVVKQTAPQEGAAVTPRAPAARSFTLGANFPPGFGVEAGYEIDQRGAEPARTTAERFELVAELFEIIRRYDLSPVLVMDDTDAWLNTAWQRDAEAARAGFFTHLPRVIAEEFGCAAVIAVHTHYLGDAAYHTAEGFLDHEITVPAVPDAAGLHKIVDRRIAIAFASREVPPGQGRFSGEAIELMFDYYARTTRSLRRGILSIANSALTLAADAGSARIEAEHVRAVIAERVAEGEAAAP